MSRNGKVRIVLILALAGIATRAHTIAAEPPPDARAETRSDAATTAPAGKSSESAPAKTAPEVPPVDRALFDTDDRDIVKRGKNNVCRDRSDVGFDEVLHFRAYRSMEDCLLSGGREAK